MGPAYLRHNGAFSECNYAQRSLARRRYRTPRNIYSGLDEADRWLITLRPESDSAVLHSLGLFTASKSRAFLEEHTSGPCRWLFSAARPVGDVKSLKAL